MKEGQRVTMRAFLIMVFLVCSFGASNFEKLLKDINSNYSLSIEEDSIKKYFELDENFFNYHRLKSITILDTLENLYIMELYVGCGAGGYCEYSNLYIVDIDGNIHDILYNFQKSMGDLGFSSEHMGCYHNGGYLRIIEKEEKFEDFGKTVISSEIDTSNYLVYEGRFRSLTIDYGYLNSTRFQNLSNKTLPDLRLLRNEIFARNGHSFSSDDLREYFTNQSWYISTPELKVTEKILTKKELKMLEKIIKREKELR